MAKLTLTDLASEDNVVSPVNTAFSAIETAVENTLSRDGTSPNAMEADLDMNGNQILNLPAASASTDPVRKGELDALITVSLGINGGDVVGPSGATAATIAVMDGTTGKLITDSTLKVGADSIFNEDSTSSTTVSGGSTSILGGRVTFRGETHATEAGDIIFYSDGDERLRLDESGSQWDFQNLTIKIGSLLKNISTGTMVRGGDTTINTGFNIVLYGGSHATQANDMELRSGSTTRLAWNNSDTEWDFQNNLVKLGNIAKNTTTGSLVISGGSTINLGGNIAFRGESHATEAGDILFRNDTTSILRWDQSIPNWNFLSTDIIGVDSLTSTSLTTTTATATMLSFGTSTEKTISSGAIDGQNLSYIRVDTEADASSDTLSTIQNGVDGQILVLVAENDARSVTVNEAGNVDLSGTGGSRVLSADTDILTLMYLDHVSSWVELSYTDVKA